jgi:hypothetical protein
MITIIANHNQVSTYLSQVTGIHTTSTGLGRAKHIDSILNLHKVLGVFTRQGVIYMQQGFHPTPTHNATIHI